MIHVKIWYAEQWLGEWELSSAHHRSALAKTLQLEQVKEDSSHLLSVRDDRFTLLLALLQRKHAHGLHGASDICVLPDCLPILSKMRIRWGEWNTPNHPASNGGKCQRDHSVPLIIQNTFKRQLTLHGTSKSGPEESSWCHGDAITSKGWGIGGHLPGKKINILH